jgi:hypothetical protein
MTPMTWRLGFQCVFLALGLALFSPPSLAQQEEAPTPDSAPAKDGPEKPEAKPDNAENAKISQDWLLNFNNGDTLHGQPLAVFGDKLAFSSSIAPESSMTISLALLESATRRSAEGAEGEEGTGEGQPPPEDEGGAEGGAEGRDKGKGGEAGKPTKDAASANDPSSLFLSDGSLLRGDLMAISSEAITFNVSGIGELRFPRRLVTEFARAGAPDAPARGAGLDAQAGSETLITARGDVIAGKVLQLRPDALRLESEGLSAEIQLGQIARIVFSLAEPAAETPAAIGPGVELTPENPENPEKPAEDPEKPSEDPEKPAEDPETSPEPEGEAPKAPPVVSIRMSMNTGSTLFGTNPLLVEGKLSFTLEFGQLVQVPLSAVSRMSFGTRTEGLGERNILLWTCFSDKDGELKNTVDGIKKQLPRWELNLHETEVLDKDFERKLGRARVLVIPEPESWRPGDADALGRTFKKLSQEFLARGGRIVTLGFDSGPCRWLKKANIIDVSKTNDSSDEKVTFTPAGRGIGRGIGDGFTSVNATYVYKANDKERIDVLATTPAGEAVILSKRIGRGQFLMMGTDFYLHNDELDKVLANLITGSR